MKLKLEVDKPEVKKTIVVYSGRFQPFHKGHFISYQKLVSKFGRENVYIGTSNVTDSGKSPFTFDEKKKIATKIFGVPSDKFVQIKNPYAPKEILDKYDGKTTQYVAAVGEKDATRLAGKYFKPYKGKAGYGYDEIGYVYAVPAEPNPISGTDVRTNFKGADEKKAKDFFKKIYPKFNDEIYQMIKNKLNEAGTGFPTGMAGSFDKINVIDDEDLNTEGFPGGIGTGLVLPGGYINGAPTGSANESVNTNPSSKLRPEPHPTRHQIEHPAEEEDAFDGNMAPYDPIAEIIANAITENDFNHFIANYLNEQPENAPQNPIYDKELTYTAKDGQKKKITVRGALRLPADHEAHIQAKKLTQNVAQPIKPAPEKKPTPPQKGQPVQKGQTQQGKVDKKPKGDGSDKGGEEQPQPQTLKGAELKSSAEHAKDKEKAKESLMNVVKTLDKEDREFISNGEHKAGSSARNGMMNNIKSGLQKFGNGIKQWAENKKEMVKGSGEAVWALANGQKIGSTKNKETGKWEYSDEKRKEQIHHLKEFAIDTALIMGSMALGGAGAAAIKAVNAGASLGGTFAAAGSGAVGVFTHGVGGFSAHLAKDIAKHATLETLGLGAKQAAIGGAGLATASMGLLEIAGGTDFVNNVLKKVSEKMETYELSDEQLKNAVVDYKKEKDKGELSSLFGSLNENLSPSKAQNIQHFIEYATKRLKLNEKPKVVLLKDNELDREQPSLGGYSPLTKEIFVVTSGRLTADILRTIAHEMVHRKQDEMKLIRNEEEAGKTGSPVENQANALAGILLRDYGKLNKQIYTETIKKVGDDYVVYPKKGGKRLGTHSSLASAKKQLAAIEINKEDITLDIDKGDEILMGKFKNKKTTVKDIGKDQHGMPTINGKQATTFRKIEEINKGFFKGKMKIGGNEVEVEVELIGADNKNRNYVTKVVGIDKKYQHKLPIGSTLPIPSRIFRWGGWAKIKVPSAFNEAEVKSNSADKVGLIICDNCGHDWYKSEGGNAMYICHVCGYDNQPANKKKLNEALAPKNVKAYYEAIAKAEGLNPLPVKFGSVGKGGAALTFNSKTMKPLYITFDVNRMSDPEYAVIHELTHQIKLETEKDAYQGKKDQSASFKKVESKLVNKYFYSNYSKLLYSKQLNEGGAYGHMAHPFDDMNLTFGDLKNIITGALNGELELTREKTDGQALAISWKNGRLIAARNKGHLANAGANAMGIEGVASKFGGRGGLTDAYNFAMKDLSAAIQSLSEKQRQKIFNEGKCFMNLEVIWPTSVNVIPYGQALLVFHNTTCYDEKGNAVGSDQSAATILAGMIKQINADVQSKYTIQGPPVTELPKNEELGSKQSKYLSKLSKLQNEFRLSDGDTVALYHQKWWENFVDEKAPKVVDKLTKEALVRRWAFGEKSFRLASISDEDIKKWAIETDKVDVMKQQKTNIKPFEEIFLGVGADVLSFMGSVLTANPNGAIRSMKSRLKSTAERVRQSGDKSLISKLKQELERLNSLGGKDKIVPNEGIVFVYKGNTYKLTGTFAPLNQILGLFY